MNPFRKKSVSYHEPQGGVYDTFVAEPVSVSAESGSFQYLESKFVDPADHSKVLVLPSRDQYDLMSMLALGQLPQEVKVSGMIQDDEQPDVIGTFNRLKNMETETPPTTEPTTISEPSKE